MQGIFEDATVVHSYSRAQAIEDGVLVDIGTTAREAGFRFPVAMTRSVWDKFVKVPPRVECQDEAGRLWDILWMCSLAAKRTSGSVIRFKVHVRNNNRRGMPPAFEFKAICGPGDDMASVITIMLPHED